MKTIAFTGGSGFIGRYIVDVISELQLDCQRKNLDLVAPKFEFGGESIIGDVRHAESCDRLVNGADCVIHLAAAHRDFGIERDEYFDVNENGTQVLLDSMNRVGLKKLIFTSSVAVYNPNGAEIDETTTPDPQNPYGESKLAAEKVIEQWIENDRERSALIIRPTVVIGPRNRATMYALIDQIYRGKYLFNIGAGDNIKSLSIAKNLASFILDRISRDQFPNGIQLTNFVDAPQMPTRDTIKIIHEELSKSMPKLTIPLGLVAMMAIPFDLLAKCTGRHSPITPARVRKLGQQTKFNAKALQGLGYKPVESTEEGLRSMVRWYQSQR